MSGCCCNCRPFLHCGYGFESWWENGKVYFASLKKCTLVQALRLCTGRTAHMGSRGIALLIHDHGTRRGWGVSVTPRRLFTPGKDPVPIVQEAGWAPGPVWTSAENLAPTGIRSPDRPARSQSILLLYCTVYFYCSRTVAVTSSITNRREHSSCKRNGLSTGKEIIPCL
jgi:hypothetical protein